MPVYEYECRVCHCRFERRQRFDEEPVAMCPQCRGKARRIIHSVPVIFKGGGFYTTDHRKSDASNKGEGELPAKAKEEGKGKRK